MTYIVSHHYHHHQSTNLPPHPQCPMPRPTLPTACPTFCNHPHVSGLAARSKQSSGKQVGSSRSSSKQSSTRHLRFLLHMLRLVSWVVVPWVVTVVTWLSLSFACHWSVTRPSLAHHSPILTHTHSYSLPPLSVLAHRRCFFHSPSVSSLSCHPPCHHLPASPVGGPSAVPSSWSEPPVSVFCPHSFGLTIRTHSLTPSLPLTPPLHRSTIPRAQTLRGKHPGSDRHTHTL